MAVWVGDVSLTLSAPTHYVGPTPVGALSHGPGMDGNDPLLRHISRVNIIRNGRPSLVLGDDHSHMGGSDDMKSGVVIVEIVWILATSYLCFWDWTWNVHCGIDMYIDNVTLSRLIVLYSRCRVNRSTNLSAVCVLCNHILLPLRVWATYAFPSCGVHPHYG